MTILYATARDNILRMVGYSDSTATTAQKIMLYQFLDEAARYFRQYNKVYYTDDVAYKPAVATTERTIDIAAGSTSYDLDITFASPVVSQELIGGVILQGDERNVIREVVTTSSPAGVKLLLPSRFTDDSATLYRRCVIPSDRFTVSKPFRTWGICKVNALNNIRMNWIEESNFFMISDIDNPNLTYPTRYTFVDGYIIVDKLWNLSPSYSVSMKAYRNLTEYSSDPDTETIDVPDQMQSTMEQYALGKFMTMFTEQIQQGRALMSEAKMRMQKWQDYYA